jgi:molecular chaperone DnaK
MKLGEAMYKAAQGGDGGAGGPDMGGSGASGRQAADDGVVDADFEEVKDDDRKSA